MKTFATRACPPDPVSELPGSASPSFRHTVPAEVHAKRILVADGHASHLQFIRQSLERDRHRVTTAHCGKEAIEYLSLHEFDAVLLDLHMSDIDGETVFKLYRFGKLHAAPTYILTADTSAATAARLKECGAQGVLHKPVASEDLRSTIATLFR